jgi:hypothetical protein
MLDFIVRVLNADAVIALIPTVGLMIVAWATRRSSKATRVAELVAKYSGTIISGIKQAEKAIPDDADNKAIRRLDMALQYVVKVIEQYERKQLGSDERGAIESAISEIHHTEVDA